MIPRSDAEVNPAIPKGAAFWVPTAEDISEEGIGFFVGTWAILNVDLAEARALLDSEKLALDFADKNSATPEEFEAACDLIEEQDYDEPTDDAPDFVRDRNWYGLASLEVGVAGLTYAMAARGFVPAASCRSHHHERTSWARQPVVMFAGDREQIDHLAPLVAKAGCGLDLDSARGELLCVYGPSIVETIALAEAILNDEGFPARTYEVADW